MKLKSCPEYLLPLGLVSALTLTQPVFAADDTAVAIESLQKQVEALQKELERLKASSMAPTPVPAAPGAVARTEDELVEGADSSLLGNELLRAKGLSIKFYGESKYRFPEAGADSFDAHRYVLSPNYAITDWLIFNSELELEHGGVDDGSGRGSRFDGELELEQFYVDILINKHFNIRSLGIDLVPVGRVNLYHEPTLFYSTERPELYREIIPTTWMEPSVSVFGQITDTLDYRVMVSAGMEDYVSSAAGGGITGGGFRNARPRLRAADENNLAYSGRLHWNGIDGLDASTSFYITSVDGSNKRDSTIALWDIEALYRIPKTGLELRGDFAYWFIDSPENLIANNNASLTDDVGESAYGWYVEAAYHFWPEAWREGKGARMDLVPFVRFSQITTQTGLSSGQTALDDGTTNKDFLTAGLAYFLSENFVIKADYRYNLDGSDASGKVTSAQDYFQVGVGMAF